jgi:predicted dehydrogenase
MTKKITWGILGTGRIATAFLTAMRCVDDAEVVTVASRSQENADRFASQFNISHALPNYSTLAEQTDVHVIYIATPPSLHKDNVIMCLEAGKAVLCEKPFTINAGEAETLIELARSKNLFLMEAMWTRYIPAVVKLRELLKENIIGDVQIMLSGGAFMPEFDLDFYLFKPELGGGVLLDAGVYLISIASMLFGKPSSISALASIGNTGVDEHDAYLLQHENGALANLYVSLRGQSSPDLTLLGSKGKITLHPPLFCPSKLTLELYNSETQIIDMPFESNGYQFEIMEVNACLRKGLLESDNMPLDESLQIMRTMDEMRRQIGLKYPME